MEVLWSPWVIGSIIVYIVIFLVGLAIADGVSGTIVGFAASTLMLFVVIGAIFNVVYFVFSSEPVANFSKAPELAEEFGLESGQNYPLVMGDRVGGSTVEAAASSGLFSARASVSTQPASALSIDFTHDSKSFVLELPMSGTTFIQSTTEEPSVVLHLVNEVHENESMTYVGSSDSCTPVVRNLMLKCVTIEDGQRVDMSEATARRGLGPIVQEHFDSATITLTPDMYYDLLGAEQPTREE